MSGPLVEKSDASSTGGYLRDDVAKMMKKRKETCQNQSGIIIDKNSTAVVPLATNHNPIPSLSFSWCLKSHRPGSPELCGRAPAGAMP